jgi:hypothetical protein
VRYYGHRFYSPEFGWISRDPIGERGGRNLYGFCRNAPISLWDAIGREACRSAYEFDDRGKQYANTWDGSLVLETTLGTATISGEWGITLTDYTDFGHCCVCKAGGWFPQFILKMFSESYILERGHDAWTGDVADEAEFGDPDVDDVWWWEWYRPIATAGHEKEHRKHGKKNYKIFRDALQDYESTSFDDATECIDSAYAFRLAQLIAFYRRELTDKRVLHGE